MAVHQSALSSNLAVALLALLLVACQTVPPQSQEDRPVAGFYQIQEMYRNTASCSSPGPKVEARIGKLVRLQSRPEPDAVAHLLECEANCKCRSSRIAGYKARAYGAFVIYKKRNVCEVTLTDYWVQVKADSVVLERRNYQKVMVDAVCDIDVERETFRRQDTPCISRETIVLAPVPVGTCTLAQ
jgi:hypothetical protein